MKRNFDLMMSITLLILFAIPMCVIAAAVRLTSKGPILYCSDRNGKDNVIIKMPKFRTMRVNAPIVATHLMDDTDKYITPIGGFLRRTSLDELPQLFTVLKGNMSLVGPRPALFNQHDLISLRTDKGVDKLLPGITGWAQVKGRDDLSISDKVTMDVEYIDRQSFWFDLKILFITIFKVIKKDGVKP